MTRFTFFRSLRRLHAAGPTVIGAALLLFGIQQASAGSGDFAFGKPGRADKADRVVNLAMKDLSFEPGSLAAKAGETIRFVVTNEGALEHDFTLGDAATQAAHHKEMAEMFTMHGEMHHDDDPNAIAVNPGETGELTWRFTKVGNLLFACNVPGHEAMKGTIAVTP